MFTFFNISLSHSFSMVCDPVNMRASCPGSTKNCKSCDLHGLGNTGHQHIGFLLAEVKGKTTHMIPTSHLCYQFTDSFISIIESPSGSNQLTVVAFNSELIKQVIQVFYFNTVFQAIIPIKKNTLCYC